MNTLHLHYFRWFSPD